LIQNSCSFEQALHSYAAADNTTSSYTTQSVQSPRTTHSNRTTQSVCEPYTKPRVARNIENTKVSWSVTSAISSTGVYRPHNACTHTHTSIGQTSVHDSVISPVVCASLSQTLPREGMVSEQSNKDGGNQSEQLCGLDLRCKSKDIQSNVRWREKQLL
jgi:hypothetical protein